MAEFSEVMSQFMRLCDSIEDCENCPVFQEGFSCESDHQGFSKTGAEEFEAIIMQWAAEHPEPVYPTWEQVIAEMYLRSGRTKYHNIKEWEINEHIPADIAEKLGIEPKGGIA